VCARRAKTNAAADEGFIEVIDGEYGERGDQLAPLLVRSRSDAVYRSAYKQKSPSNASGEEIRRKPMKNDGSTLRAPGHLLYTAFCDAVRARRRLQTKEDREQCDGE
jgi:hypothetical protein